MYRPQRQPSLFWMNVAAVVAAACVVVLVFLAVRSLCSESLATCFGGTATTTIAPLPTAVPTARPQQQGGAIVVPQQQGGASGETAVLGGIPGSGDPDVGGGAPPVDAAGGIIIEPAWIEAVPTATTDGWAWAQNMAEPAKERIIDELTDDLPIGIAAPSGGDCAKVDAPLFCMSRAGEGQP